MGGTISLTIFMLSAFRVDRGSDGNLVAGCPAWTSYPVGLLSHMALEQTAPMWVRQVHLSPGTWRWTRRSLCRRQMGAGENAVEVQPSALCLWAANLRCAGTDGPWPRRVGRVAAGYRTPFFRHSA